MKAYTYWECSYCSAIIRGDSRACPNCGAPIPNNVKYMMPDDPRVAEARRNGKILTKDNAHVDEKGIIAEIVEPDKERSAPNWKCTSCGFQNFAEATTCAGCGAPKSGISYFDAEESESNDIDSDDDLEVDEEESSSAFSHVSDERVIAQENTDPEPESKRDEPSIFTRLKDFICQIPLQYVFGTIGAIAVIAFLIWLFTPVWNVATITKFEWTQNIEVEEFTLCHEHDWSVPAGGRTTRTSEEIHHYDTVLDHYETKSRQVSEQVLDGYDTEYREVAEQVFDGYDTEYRDLGNGQCDVIQTPRYRTEYHTESYQVPKYRTEWHTEYYEEPVYVQVPVYKTMYYYDIDRWVYHSTLTTHEFSHEPYWYETDIPEDIDNPEYGDLRLGSRNGEYKVHLTSEDGVPYYLTYSLNDWTSLSIGDELRYKSFRFSRKPLSDTEVKHRENQGDS